MGLMWGLNELIYLKYVEEYQAYSKHYIYIS